MDKSQQERLKEFFKVCYERLDAGDKLYGDRFETIDLLDEIEQELADVSNYAFLQYVKIELLKNKLEKAGRTEERR